MAYITAWVASVQPCPDASNVVVLRENPGARTVAIPLLVQSVKEHLIGADILERLRFEKAGQAVRNRLPIGKRVRSGNLAEILATDYLNETGPFVVPLKRLKYQDDREMPMRGDDLLGLDTAQAPVRVLKGEVKSRQDLAAAVLTDICDALNKYEGRPKPTSLSFTSMMLRVEGKDTMAQIVEQLQENDVDPAHITHFGFTLSANDPTELLRTRAVEPVNVAQRQFVGMIVTDHQQFIESVFTACNA